MDLQEIPWNEIRDTAYKVLCYSSEVTFIIHRSHPNLTSFVGHAHSVKVLGFEGNPSNGRPDTSENVLCSPSKVPFIVDGWDPHSHRM